MANETQSTAVMTEGVTEGVTENPPEVTVVGSKTKKQKTGNLILDIAHEVELLTKTKAINEAARLAEDIEVNYFKLGGVLKLINDNSWFEGYQEFDAMVYNEFGFQGRKARYLMSIYDNLVTKQIPWELVQHLGWTKLKDLAPILTLENVEEWVAKATPVTVAELQAMLKATANQGSVSSKTTDDIVKRTFKFKADQNETVDQALAKAKGEIGTEFDNVAIENICAGYLGGNTSVKSINLDDVLKSTDFGSLMERIAALYPEYDITVGAAGDVVPTQEVVAA